MNALFALSGVTSVCSAHPAKSREAAAPLNRSSTKRCSDISPMRANSRRPSTRAPHANLAPARTGGNGVRSASTTASPYRRHWSMIVR